MPHILPLLLSLTLWQAAPRHYDSAMTALRATAAHKLDSLETALPACRDIAQRVGRKRRAQYKKTYGFIASDQYSGPGAIAIGDMILCRYGYVRPRHKQSGIVHSAVHAWRWFASQSQHDHQKFHALLYVYYSLRDDQLMATATHRRIPKSCIPYRFR